MTQALTPAMVDQLLTDRLWQRMTKTTVEKGFFKFEEKDVTEEKEADIVNEKNHKAAEL